MLFSFHHFGFVARAQSYSREVFTGGNGYTSAPHSLMKVSPSAPAFVEEAVQRVAVRIPPLTSSTSCSLKARAPRRSNTLFWSFIAFISFRDFGSINGPGLQKSFRLRWTQPKNI
jgi:hypothetical protein